MSTTATQARGSYRRFAWIGMAVVLAVALVIGGTRQPSAETSGEHDEERAQAIAESVMCPTCRGQAVADSDSSAARGMRSYIDRRISDGASDDEIRDALADRYGDDILLSPGRSGWSGLVWSLPVIALVVALAGVVFAFRHWRGRGPARASAADREIVDHARDELAAKSPEVPTP